MQRFEVMNDKFVENEIPKKSHKKLKIAIAIVASIAIITTTVLLVGYFNFHWFQSEIYDVDAKISRVVYQSDYFTETKTLKTTTTFSSGETEEKDFYYTTNFLVMQTDRKELDNKAILNTANLVILNSKVNMENQEKEISSFNIFDSIKLDEAKANPDGSKYPVAKFSYYDNGTIFDILLPKTMDLYNAQSIKELIENIIPKLTRNRTEDEDNGLNINTRKDKKKRTMIETQEPKEIPKFRKSRYQKTIERDIEDEQITNIRSRASLSLKTEKEEGEEGFGIKDHIFDQKSDILLVRSKVDRVIADTFKTLDHIFDLRPYSELINIFDKKSAEDHIFDEWEEDLKTPDSKVRQLGFSISKSNTYTLKTFNVLGTSIAIKLNVGVSGGKAFCKLIVGGASFGKDGITAEYSKTFGTGKLTIFYFAFPAMPAISVSLTGEASITLSIKFASSAKTKLNFSLTGAVKADAFVKAGWDAVASVKAGASGTLVSATISAGVQNSGITYSKSLSGGKIVAYIKGTALTFEIFKYEKTLFNGWSC